MNIHHMDQRNCGTEYEVAQHVVVFPSMCKPDNSLEKLGN